MSLALIFELAISIGQILWIYKSTDEEVWCRIVSLRQLITIAQILATFSPVEEVYIVLDDILCIGYLLVSWVLVKAVALIIVLAITYEVNVFVVDKRLIPVDVVNDFAVFLFFQTLRELRLAYQAVDHILKDDVEVANEQSLIWDSLLCYLLSPFVKSIEQVPQLH